MTNKITKKDVEIYLEPTKLDYDVEQLRIFDYENDAGLEFRILNNSSIPSITEFGDDFENKSRQLTKFTRAYSSLRKLMQKHNVELREYSKEICGYKKLNTIADLSDLINFFDNVKKQKYGTVPNLYNLKLPNFDSTKAKKELSSGRSVKNFIETRLEKRYWRMFGDLEPLDEIKFSLTSSEQESLKTAKYLYGFSYNQKFIFPMSKYYSVDEFVKLTDNYYFDVISRLQDKYFKNSHVDSIPKILDKYWHTIFELIVATDIAKKLDAKEMLWLSDGKEAKHLYNLRYKDKNAPFITRTIAKLNKLNWTSKIVKDFEYHPFKEVFYVDCTESGYDYMIKDNRYILNCSGAVVHE